MMPRMATRVPEQRGHRRPRSRLMDRRRATGVALVLVSAAAFGSGSLFAQPVYAAGVGWMTLSAWRFLFGAGFTWCFLLLSADRRAQPARARSPGGRRRARAGRPVRRQFGTYYASLETVSPSLAALVVYLYPAIVAVLSLRFGHRLSGAGPGSPWGSRCAAWSSPSAASIRTRARPYPACSSRSPRASSTPCGSSWPRGCRGAARGRRSRRGRRRLGDRDGRPDHDRDSDGLLGVRPGDEPQPVLPAQIPTDAWPGLIGVGVVGHVHRHPDVLCRSPARRRGACVADRHRRADLDDRAGGDPVPGGPDAGPARRAAR